MSQHRDEGQALGRGAQLFDTKEVERVLSGSFYTPEPGANGCENAGLNASDNTHGSVLGLPKKQAQVKPPHYKVICISMYNQDLSYLDTLVDALKSRGMTKASRSALIRIALEQLDIDKIQRGL